MDTTEWEKKKKKKHKGTASELTMQKHFPQISSKKKKDLSEQHPSFLSEFFLSGIENFSPHKISQQKPKSQHCIKPECTVIMAHYNLY